MRWACSGTLNVAQADVFGFSVGGAVALYLAIKHPEPVRVVRVVPPDGDRPENAEAVEALTVDAIAGTAMERDYRAKSTNPDRLQDLLDKLGRFDAGFTGLATPTSRGSPRRC
jgi:pimeloyl-ACP methyl ester carboxylesterase